MTVTINIDNPVVCLIRVNVYTCKIFCHFHKEKQLLWLPVCFPG